MTSTSEYGCGEVGDNFGLLTRDLLNNLTLAHPFDNLNDLSNWFTRTGQAGHEEKQTYTVTTFNGADRQTTYYAAVPEPSTVVLVACGIATLWLRSQNLQNYWFKGSKVHEFKGSLGSTHSGFKGSAFEPADL